MGRNVVVLAFHASKLTYLYSLLTGTSVMLGSILR